MDDHADIDLLHRFRVPATREAAFTDLIKKYQERLYWHIRRLVVSHEDANDLLQ
ncbi:MAG: RNA polymerase subunit sigma, partial [Sphingomonadales bacterium]|nr:RNA polymerase subunit sigma [Sphingomonadales bacterium]